MDIQEQFIRLAPLFNEDELQRICNTKVCIVGLGGVGSVCALTLARTGIQNFILCDFDKVNLSNCNRQLIATLSTVDQNKTDIMEQMIFDINKEAKITKINEHFSKDSSLFANDFDFLIDAIDDIENKTLLIKTCIEKNIPFISSMGTAKKLDPKKISIMKLSKTTYDPIAKILRKNLRDLHLNIDKINVLSSTEEKIDSKILGSYMPVTATAGLLLADYVIKQIIQRRQ